MRAFKKGGCVRIVRREIYEFQGHDYDPGYLHSVREDPMKIGTLLDTRALLAKSTRKDHSGLTCGMAMASYIGGEMITAL